MRDSLKREIASLFEAKDLQQIEVIQTLWSGYGEIIRLKLIGSHSNTLIAKNITLPIQVKHPRGWNTSLSHQRKIKSYQVEIEWYKKWAHRCNSNCRVPKCYQALSKGDEHTIILEDLDALGFPVRKSHLTICEAKLGLKWLANFHAEFMGEIPHNLWQEGTYWHLKTRPDEFDKMEAGKLKDSAIALDRMLKKCQFKTIVHGDAKVANFCFSEDMSKVAAVDFQYVGGGCGMKDVVYFLGSCLTEKECQENESEFLEYYFKELCISLNHLNKGIQVDLLEKEWSAMYAIAWADFTRFMLGWMPTHKKLNGYSWKMVKRAILDLK